MKKALSALTMLAGISLILGLQKSYMDFNFKQFSVGSNLENTTSVRTEQLYLLSTLPKLGFENLFADGIFLKFLQYFGNDPLREQTGYGLSPDFFSLILANDPYYIPFYIFASSSSTMYAGQPTRSVALLNQGLKQLQPNKPADSFLVWRYKAADELLFLGDSDNAKASYQMAADWADVSNHPDSELVAQLSRRMVQSLQVNPDNKIVRINAWLGLLNSALDDTSRQRIIEEIRALGGDISIDNSTGKINVTLPVE
ncbi:hypothetical protein [Leptothoe spongobia]|uniref:Uncharacterized protein n=1 Tax=Leptothoe spongobia TAU-MAC 1115 TaxID=1967444 RepID=A0A947DE61_9CYAN|nr:hypothetical protein [Leptothoe spongobia]MBT9315230.1 hypothetical protein [Leptothoe spongobia TAU-MAC 1115]